MEEAKVKLSRRDAIKRMAKASMGIGIGLQHVGTFVPIPHTGLASAKGERFNTIGQVVSVAAVAAPEISEMGVYTNGCSYAGGYRDVCYGKYEKED